MEKLRGSWSGQLIDVGGFEGSVNLSLRETRGTVDGVFDVTIAGQHKPLQVRGLVSGRIKGRQLVLILDAGLKNASASVSFEGGVFGTRAGGLGVCGRYTVSARRSSPLLGGVICVRQASSDSEGGVLKSSVVAPVLGSIEPRRSAKTRTAGARRGK